MEDPKIEVEVKHSESKPAWNIIGTQPGKKYKIARVPYLVIDGSEMSTEFHKSEALRHAKFISYCFNNSAEILMKTVL
jgi:hypothetical protein